MCYSLLFTFVILMNKLKCLLFYFYFRMMHTIKEVECQVLEHGEKLNRIQRMLEQLAIRQRGQRDQNVSSSVLKNCVDTLIVIVVVFFVQYFMKLWNRNNIDANSTW